VVVDDVASNCLFLARLLQRRGVRTLIAADGIEALQLFDALPQRLPAGVTTRDVVWLLDRTMPRMDGTQLARELRNRGVTNPIIGVSGDALDAASFKAAGADHVLIKPCTLPDIRVALSALGWELP
jgi:two-component system capsular synthesis sensor histidine kinase RcsC